MPSCRASELGGASPFGEASHFISGAANYCSARSGSVLAGVAQFLDPLMALDAATPVASADDLILDELHVVDASLFPVLLGEVGAGGLEFVGDRGLPLAQI